MSGIGKLFKWRATTFIFRSLAGPKTVLFKHDRSHIIVFMFGIRDVKAVIFQSLPLPLSKNEKTTVDLSKFVIYYSQKV